MAKFSDVAPAPKPREWLGKYLTSEEKAAAVGSVFQIPFVEYRPNGYNGKAEWDVGVVDARTGTEWTITLTDNPTRHAMFEAVAKALASGETIDPVVFGIVGTNKRGNPPYGFRDATPDEIAAAAAARREWDARERLDEAESILPVPAGVDAALPF